MTQRSVLSFFKKPAPKAEPKAEDPTSPVAVAEPKAEDPASPRGLKRAQEDDAPAKKSAIADAADKPVAQTPNAAANAAPDRPTPEKVSPAKLEAPLKKVQPAAQAPKKTGPAPDPVTAAEFRSEAFDPSRFIGAGPVRFKLAADAFALIEEVKGSGKGSKKQATIILTNLFRTILVSHSGDIAAAVYMTVNKLAPDYENVETQIGDALLIKAISEVYGRTAAHIKASMVNQEACDLGEVAMQSRVAQKMLFTPKPLMLAKVFSEIRSMADQKGNSSMQKRRDILKTLLVAGQGEEPKFIIRSLQCKMRMGVQKQTVLQAIAHAFVLTRNSEDGWISDVRKIEKLNAEGLEKRYDSLEAAVKEAFSSLPSYDRVLEELSKGVSEEELVKVCAMTPGIPVSPMLAKPTKGITEILDRFANIEFTAEWKYDGERAQVHIHENALEVYSRNSENTSMKYPDAIANVREAMKPGITSCILDCEVVAWDTEAKKILPFQILTSRKRKIEDVSEIKVQIVVYVFDMIYLNGESLCNKPLIERREKLHSSLNEVEDKLQFAKYLNISTQEEMETMLDESIAGACEGLMLKTLKENATYEPSRRSFNWLKLKKDYLEGMGDTVDLVVLGAFYGKGKRSGCYGAFLVGCYDADEGEYQSTCKVGTGFTDEYLDIHYKFLKEHVVNEKPFEYNISERMVPDVWFEPCQVWECKAADLQISPIHTAAMGAKADGKGIGLRFPRFLHIREDKSPEDCTAASQIVEMYEAQSAVQGAGGGGAEESD